MNKKGNNFIDTLKDTIIFIQNKYNEISEEWIKNDKYIELNMKKYKVEDIYTDEKILSYILNYRNFINDRAIKITNSIRGIDAINTIQCRVKALNSVQYKIENYKKNHEDGKIPIRKCLNDLYGIRLITNEQLEYEKIKQFIDENFPKLKCIYAKRGEYQAIHIYFGNEDNKKFQWELQLWDKIHEESNYLSHAKHKQGYTKWEKENNII